MKKNYCLPILLVANYAAINAMKLNEQQKDLLFTIDLFQQDINQPNISNEKRALLIEQRDILKHHLEQHIKAMENHHKHNILEKK